MVVSNNILRDIGGTGIDMYKNCFQCSAVNNAVNGWGKIPLASSIRNYNGTYVVAREFPTVGTAPFPIDPTASTWWEEYPYSLENVNTSAIKLYDANDYYSANNLDGVLPYRGHSAINATQETLSSVISNNSIQGNLTLDGSSKYLYASDYGISPIHVRNSPTSTTMGNSFITNNQIFDCRVYRIYHPQYHDTVNGIGLLGTATYLSNRDSSSSIYKDNLRISQGGDTLLKSISFTGDTDGSQLSSYKEGAFTPIFGTQMGVATVNSSSGSYVKIGKLVHVSMLIDIATFDNTTPGGIMRISGLPFYTSSTNQTIAVGIGETYSGTNIFTSALARNITGGYASASVGYILLADGYRNFVRNTEGFNASGLLNMSFTYIASA